MQKLIITRDQNLDKTFLHRLTTANETTEILPLN